MNTAISTADAVLTQRQQAVPGWFKFLGGCILAVYFLIFAVVSAYIGHKEIPDFIVIYSENILLAQLIMWSMFAMLAVSYCGLISGRYWGLYACMLLGYWGLADSLYTLVSEGRIDLSILFCAVLLHQLHKIKGRWARI